MCHKELPENYIFHDKIDLKNNKKQFWIVQGISLVILVVMMVAGYFIDFSFTGNSYEPFIALAVLVVGFVVYIILHEAVHGLFMYAFLKAKINFGFCGWAAYAGSTGYYDKKRYIVIALAPLITFGVIFAVLNVFFHSGMWFWVIWVLQIANVSGASGDMFCTYKMLTYPKNILVRDTGIEMTVYRVATEEELNAMKNADTENGDCDDGVKSDD